MISKKMSQAFRKIITLSSSGRCQGGRWHRWPPWGSLAGADPLKGEKLAVIGAGPIGLRAALELALLGAEVPGEKVEELGGPHRVK